jgi:D-alanyl-D-alanine carboxypeptidase
MSRDTIRGAASWQRAGALALALLLGCARAPVPAAPEAAPTPALDPERAALAQKLDALARAALHDGEAPVAGLSVRVLSHGRILLARGYGFADLLRRRAVREDTIFRIGSITKQFTAAAVLQLEEQGKLQLSDPITKHLKEYPALSSFVTVQQLLTHTSGLPGYTELPWFASHMNRQVSHQELVTAFTKEPLAFEPGSRFAYSNSGYYLLGLLIEQLSGETYADYLRAHVLPGAVQDTRYCPDAQDYERAALGYQVRGGKLEPSAPLSMTLPYAAGALCSTVADLVQWSLALSRGWVLSAQAFERMSAETTLGNGDKSRYGFGLARAELDGHVRIGHGGGINGFASDLAYYPQADLFIAVLVNTEGAAASALSEKLARVVLGIPEPELKDLPLLEAEVKPLLGTYAIQELGQTLLVAWDGSTLKLGPAQRPAQGRRMRSQGGGVFVVPELKARISFELVAGVAKAMVVYQHGHEFRGERLP